MQTDSDMILGDVLIGLNIAGIGLVLLASIVIRITLNKRNITLDKKIVSASDYGLVVEGVPLDWTQNRLKTHLEALIENFPKEKQGEIIYIIFMKDIDKVVTLNAKMEELNMKKASLIIQIKKHQSREENVDKFFLKRNGSVDSRKLDSIYALSRCIQDLKRQIEKCSKEELNFNGIAVVVLDNQKTVEEFVST